MCSSNILNILSKKVANLTLLASVVSD